MKAAHNLGVSLVGVSIAVDDNAVVCLVDKMRAAADVIQVRRVPPPALQGHHFMAPTHLLADVVNIVDADRHWEYYWYWS